MKAVALLVLALGVLMIVIGFKGSQHTILPVIKGIAPAARNATGTSALSPAQGTTQSNTNSTTTTTGQPVGQSA